MFISIIVAIIVVVFLIIINIKSKPLTEEEKKDLQEYINEGY